MFPFIAPVTLNSICFEMIFRSGINNSKPRQIFQPPLPFWLHYIIHAPNTVLHWCQPDVSAHNDPQCTGIHHNFDSDFTIVCSLMESLNLDSFTFIASFSERVVFFFYKEKHGYWIALISASTPLLTLVIGCNMLIYRKQNQMNPAMILFSLSLIKDVCPKYFGLLFFIFVSLLNCRIRASGPHTGFYVTSPSMNHTLGCSATAGVFYMFSIFICYAYFQRRVQSACYLPETASVLDSSYWAQPFL